MNEDDIAAALFAPGACNMDELASLRERLTHDSAFVSLVESWEMLLGPLASFVPEARLPRDLLGKIEARLDGRQRLEALSRTLSANEGEWIRFSAGVRIRILENQSDRRTILLDVEPGAQYAAHDHAGDEEIFMISGDLVIGDLELAAGDYHVSPKGSSHPAATSRKGCRCIVAMAAA